MPNDGFDNFDGNHAHAEFGLQLFIAGFGILILYLSYIKSQIRTRRALVVIAEGEEKPETVYVADLPEQKIEDDTTAQREALNTHCEAYRGYVTRSESAIASLYPTVLFDERWARNLKVRQALFRGQERLVSHHRQQSFEIQATQTDLLLNERINRAEAIKRLQALLSQYRDAHAESSEYQALVQYKQALELHLEAIRAIPQLIDDYSKNAEALDCFVNSYISNVNKLQLYKHPKLRAESTLIKSEVNRFFLDKQKLFAECPVFVVLIYSWLYGSNHLFYKPLQDDQQLKADYICQAMVRYTEAYTKACERTLLAQAMHEVTLYRHQIPNIDGTETRLRESCVSNQITRMLLDCDQSSAWAKQYAAQVYIEQTGTELVVSDDEKLSVTIIKEIEPLLSRRLQMFEKVKQAALTITLGMVRLGEARTIAALHAGYVKLRAQADAVLAEVPDQSVFRASFRQQYLQEPMQPLSLSYPEGCYLAPRHDAYSQERFKEAVLWRIDLYYYDRFTECVSEHASAWVMFSMNAREATDKLFDEAWILESQKRRPIYGQRPLQTTFSGPEGRQFTRAVGIDEITEFIKLCQSLTSDGREREVTDMLALYREDLQTQIRIIKQLDLLKQALNYLHECVASISNLDETETYRLSLGLEEQVNTLFKAMPDEEWIRVAVIGSCIKSPFEIDFDGRQGSIKSIADAIKQNIADRLQQRLAQFEQARAAAEAITVRHFALLQCRDMLQLHHAYIDAADCVDPELARVMANPFIRAIFRTTFNINMQRIIAQDLLLSEADDSLAADAFKTKVIESLESHFVSQRLAITERDVEEAKSSANKILLKLNELVATADNDSMVQVLYALEKSWQNYFANARKLMCKVKFYPDIKYFEPRAAFCKAYLIKDTCDWRQRVIADFQAVKIKLKGRFYWLLNFARDKAGVLLDALQHIDGLITLAELEQCDADYVQRVTFNLQQLEQIDHPLIRQAFRERLNDEQIPSELDDTETVTFNEWSQYFLKYMESKIDDKEIELALVTASSINIYFASIDDAKSEDALGVAVTGRLGEHELIYDAIWVNLANLSESNHRAQAAFAHRINRLLPEEIMHLQMADQGVATRAEFYQALQEVIRSFIAYKRRQIHSLQHVSQTRERGIQVGGVDAQTQCDIRTGGVDAQHLAEVSVDSDDGAEAVAQPSQGSGISGAELNAAFVSDVSSTSEQSISVRAAEAEQKENSKLAAMAAMFFVRRPPAPPKLLQEPVFEVSEQADDAAQLVPVKAADLAQSSSTRFLAEQLFTNHSGQEALSLTLVFEAIPVKELGIDVSDIDGDEGISMLTDSGLQVNLRRDVKDKHWHVKISNNQLRRVKGDTDLQYMQRIMATAIEMVNHVLQGGNNGIKLRGHILLVIAMEAYINTINRGYEQYSKREQVALKQIKIVKEIDPKHTRMPAGLSDKKLRQVAHSLIQSQLAKAYKAPALDEYGLFCKMRTGRSSVLSIHEENASIRMTSPSASAAA